MQKLSTKIDDGRMLRLIRRYLEAGMMADGMVSQRTEGTPQGGPLSPLLSNILLTELDPVATVETPLYSRQELDEGRTEGRAGILLGVQPTWAVVEQWREPHEPGFPEVLL
ncbi:MAG: hypothetical protein Q8M20_03310 [Rhodocyclaceae bacterium]|nr:hypothetical protein [Rhodocyclaceae bacterium]MDZ4213406.1 hypothetical protein [Rhodocyclaceae bacterium]